MGQDRDRDGETETRRHRDGEGLRRRERQQEEGGWRGGHGGRRPDQTGESRGRGEGPALWCSSYPLLSPLTRRLSRGLPAPGRLRLSGGRQGAARPREQRTRDFRTAPQNFKPATMKWNKNHACGEGEPADGDRRKPPREERRAEDDSWRSQGPGAPKSGLGQHRLPCRGHRQGSKLG